MSRMGQSKLTSGVPLRNPSEIMAFGHDMPDFDTRMSVTQKIGYRSIDHFFGSAFDNKLDTGWERYSGKGIIIQSIYRSFNHTNKGTGYINSVTPNLGATYDIYFNDEITPFAQLDSRQFDPLNQAYFAYQPEFRAIGFPFSSLRIVRLDPIAPNDGTALRVCIMEEPFQGGISRMLSLDSMVNGGNTPSVVGSGGGGGGIQSNNGGGNNTNVSGGNNQKTGGLVTLPN